MSDSHLADPSHETAEQKAAAERKLQKSKAPLFTPKPPFFFELSRLMVVAVTASGQLVSKAQTKPNGP